jgi:hypothetical protein
MMTTRLWPGLLLIASGCAETVGAARGDAADTGSVSRDDVADAGSVDAEPVIMRPPTDDGPAATSDSSPAGPCRAGLLAPRYLGQANRVYEAMRADGDNTAVFWAEFALDRNFGVMVQRFNAAGEAVDARPITLTRVPENRAGQVATAWDHAASEPAVLTFDAPGAATLHLGGISRPATSRAITMHAEGSGVALVDVGGLRAVEGGWTFFSTTPEAPRALVQLFIQAEGETRPAPALALTLPASADLRALVSVPLLDDSVVVVLPSAEGAGAQDYQRFDARGRIVGPAGTWRGSGSALWPPIAPTRAGYLLGLPVGRSGLGLAEFDRGGTARGTRRDLALPDTHWPRAMLGALGHAFAAVLDDSTLEGRIYLREVNALGAVGPPLYLDGSNHTTNGFMLVPTSLGGMLVYTTERSAPDHALSVVPLRVCD